MIDQILVMLHPFMPFVTEELWGALGDRANYPLITAKWPEPGAEVDAEAKREIEWVIESVSAIRAAKVELNIPQGTFLSLHANSSDIKLLGKIGRNGPYLYRLATH